MLSILRSGPFRVALVFAAAVTVTTYVVFALVYVRFYQSNVGLVGSVLHDEARDAAGMSTDQLRRRLELRLTQDLRHLDYVGLFDAGGHLTYGNIALDLVVPPDGKAHLYDTRPPELEDREPAKAVFVAVPRAGGGTLVIGRSLIYAEQLERAMHEGSVVAITPVVILALGAGAIVSLRASRRLRDLRSAIRRVMGGELEVRLPSSGRSGDINALVGAVNEMLDEIARLLHQMKNVGDNIAHDLRAPLAVMRSRLERGLTSRSEETMRALVADALQDLERAMTTVTALLRISELESGLRRSAFDTLDLVLVCRDAFDLYEPLAEAKGIVLTLEAPHPVLVTGDGDLLREALANLVDNAIKFTPEGGCVAIACGVPDVLLRVSDTGPGIVSDERDKVLERFYRSNRTRTIEGHGLGLSMAVTIVELHGFGLRIRDNAPGSIFEITARPDVPAAGPVSQPILKQNLVVRRRDAP